MAGALERMEPRQQLFHHFAVLRDEVENRRVDSAWADAVDADLVLGGFERDRAREIDDAGLGRAVRMRTVAAGEPGHRSWRYDGTAADPAHLGNRMLHPEEHPAQQDGLRAIPIFDRGVLDTSERAAQAGVVESDVEAAELPDRPLDHRLDRGFGSYVGLLKHGAAAVFLALAHRGGAAFFVEVGDHDRRAFAREARRRRAAHPAG